MVMTRKKAIQLSWITAFGHSKENPHVGVSVEFDKNRRFANPKEKITTEPGFYESPLHCTCLRLTLFNIYDLSG